MELSLPVVPAIEAGSGVDQNTIERRSIWLLYKKMATPLQIIACTNGERAGATSRRPWPVTKTVWIGCRRRAMVCTGTAAQDHG